MPPCLAVAIGGTKDVGFRWQHHVVKVLREHCCREEGDCAQRFVTDIHEVVLYRRRNCKNTAWANFMDRAVFHVQFAGTGDDVLRFFSGVGVPPQPFPGLSISYTIVEDAVVPCSPYTANAPAQ